MGNNKIMFEKIRKKNKLKLSFSLSLFEFDFYTYTHLPCFILNVQNATYYS